MKEKSFRLEDAEIEANDLLKKIEDNSKSLDETASIIINRVNDDNEKILNYKDKLKTIKNDFRKYFSVILVLIVSSIIKIGPDVLGTNAFLANNSSNISIPSSLIHNFHMYQNLFWYTLSILIVSLILFYYAYKKKICTTDSSEKDDNEKINSQNITSSSQSSGNVRTDFDKGKDILLSIASSVGDSVPIINNLYKNTTRLGKHQQLVEKYQQALKYYNVINDDNFFQEMGKFVPAHNIITDDEDEQEKYISSKIYLYCVQKNIEASENILLLLYNEHNGKKCTDTFRKIKDSNAEVEKLAVVLIKSQRLIDPPYKYEYNREDISAIIKKIDSFSLSSINGRLTDSFFILKHLDFYIKFLRRNGINTKSYTSSIKFLIDNSGDKKVPVADIVVPLAYKIGLNIFNKNTCLNNDKFLIEGFARASITLKFHDDIQLRKKACQYSANNHAVAILRSYQKKMEINGDQRVILVRQLIKDLDMVKSFLETSNDREGTYFYKQLKNGKWYDSSFTLLMDFMKNTRDEINKGISNIKEYEMLKTAVRSAFEKVSLTTIEKSIDAQLFGAYIIMFTGQKPRKGENEPDENINGIKNTDVKGLQTIIDKLSIRDLGSSDRWNIRSDKQKNEIEEEYEYKISPKYDFMIFSPNARIGILVKGQSFSKFQHDFLNDIKTMLKLKKHEPFEIGLIIQKIMPSDHNLGIIDNYELPANIQIKDLDVVKYLAKLASTNTDFPVDYQISAMKFEIENSINLIKIINEKSFYEIIKDRYNGLTNKAENDILNSPELKESLLDELSKVGLNDFMSIGLNLRRGNLKDDTKDEVEEIIQSVLEIKCSTNKKLKGKARIRSEILSSQFMDSLEKLAILYD
jgi:hypothetical protein